MRHDEHIHPWIAIATSLAALAFSTFNFCALRREPDVDIALPNVIRIAQGEDVWLYIQPTVSAREKTEIVEVLTSAEMQIKPIRMVPGTSQPSFFWDESGTYRYDSKSNMLTYERTADPSPLPVSPENPQQPLILFNALGWNFSVGRYEGTLAFDRASGREPLSVRFCLIISKEGDVALHKAGQFGFSEFRRDVSETREVANQGCYTLSPA